MDNSIYDIFYSTSGICTDTRNIKSDSLFICIKGANFDGNTFASEALNQGAKHVIVDNPEFYTDDANMTLVTNSIDFLQKLANFHRRKFEIPVVGITGSNGKTTTKELINAVLSKKYNVLATKGNLNNHLGVPFTLLELNSTHDIAIIEMGANKFKDIEELSDIAEPTHGIITNIGKAHLEGFGGFEGVLKTKRELYEAVYNHNGVIVINADDPVLIGALPVNASTFPFGTKDKSMVHGELVQLSPFVEMTLNDNPNVLRTKMVGKYNFYNYLAAAAFGYYFDVNEEDIRNAIEEYTPTNNRSQIKKTKDNTLILDCYNANPTSMKSALESFSLMNHDTKIAILGSMKELGDDTALEHQTIIDQVTFLGINTILVGQEYPLTDSDNILAQYATTEELIANLTNHSDALILLKGSRSVGLERLEAYL